MAYKNEEIRQKIAESNQDLRERARSEHWKISYDKRTDMVYMGANFPAGTFYVPVDDSGFLTRVDRNYKVHGFAIENAKAFIKEHPEMTALNLVVRPYTTIPLALMMIMSELTISGISQFRDSLLKPVMPDYYSRKACA